jgi:hypothetical protein
MGLSLFVENQAHERTYAGPEVSGYLEIVIARGADESLLAGVHPNGDTMFNSIQLAQIRTELEAVSRALPNLGPQVEALRRTFERVIENRGYIWVSGD